MQQTKTRQPECQNQLSKIFELRLSRGSHRHINSFDLLRYCHRPAFENLEGFSLHSSNSTNVFVSDESFPNNQSAHQRKTGKIINEGAEKEAPRRQFAFTAGLKFKLQRFETIDINPWRPRKNQDHPGGNRDVAAIFLRAVIEDLKSHSVIGLQPMSACQ